MILTDPGPLCPGEVVTLTCTHAAGTSQLSWFYPQSLNIITINISKPNIPLPAVREVLGVEFSISLLSTSPDVVSQISFVATNGFLRCVGDGVVGTVLLQVKGVIGKYACECRISRIWNQGVNEFVKLCQFQDSPQIIGCVSAPIFAAIIMYSWHPKRG